MEANSWAPKANPGSDQTGAHTGQKKITASQRTIWFSRGSTTKKVYVGQSGKWHKQPISCSSHFEIENLYTKWSLCRMLPRGQLSKNFQQQIWSWGKVLGLRGALWEEECCFNGRIVESFVVWVKPSPDDASVVGLGFVSIATLQRTLSGMRQSSYMLF